MTAVGKWIVGILTAQLGTASTAEIIWSAVGLVGLILTLSLTIQAWIDLAVLKRSGDFAADGPRHIIARSNIRGNAERVMLFSLFVSIGVLAMALPSPGGRPGATALVFDAVFLLMETGLTWGALADTRARAQIFKLLYARSERTERLQIEAELAARLRDREKPTP